MKLVRRQEGSLYRRYDAPINIIPARPILRIEIIMVIRNSNDTAVLLHDMRNFRFHIPDTLHQWYFRMYLQFFTYMIYCHVDYLGDIINFLIINYFIINILIYIDASITNIVIISPSIVRST